MGNFCAGDSKTPQPNITLPQPLADSSRTIKYFSKPKAMSNFKRQIDTADKRQSGVDSIFGSKGIKESYA